jgi:hypothetical protein
VIFHTKAEGAMTAFLVTQAVHLQAIGSVVLLVGFLIASTLLLQRSVAQSSDILDTTTDRVKATELFVSAKMYFDRRNVNLFTSPTHAIPIYFLIMVVLFCSLVSFFGAEYLASADVPSYALGGALATIAPTGDGLKNLAAYQSSTVFTGSMAFLGAYIWVIAQLINRITNNDIRSTTFYYLSFRILMACVVAGVARHMIEAIPGLRNVIDYNDVPVGLAVFGFLIGWNPSLWLDQLMIWGSDLVKRSIPMQRWPNQDNMPENMTLSMIQGLVEEKIERLNEIDIDNCQKLAAENAIIIWVRTSYNLELIVDWIAQAQLCVLFEDDKVEKLRQNGVRTIFSYFNAISNDPSRAAVQALLGIPDAIVANHRISIENSPVYARLEQLCQALLPPRPAVVLQAAA